MSASFRLARAILDQTFAHFRECGSGQRECQVVWVSSWDASGIITGAIHPCHTSRGDSFVLDSAWIDSLWQELAAKNLGIQVQVHTHPGAAFHSATDDAYPIIHTPGFLSLVIPRFAMGPVGFDHAYLTEIQADGGWREVPIEDRLVLI